MKLERNGRVGDSSARNQPFPEITWQSSPHTLNSHSPLRPVPPPDPMPTTDFSSLPTAARVWVFACERPLAAAEAGPFLAQVDAYLAQWKAHGVPLRCARDWREDRFLAIGIDPTAEQASGCSIDDLFRRLREMGNAIGAQVMAGGRVFYRDATGQIRSASRAEFSAMAARGDVTADTPVFDTSVIEAEAWRTGFERSAGETWTRALLGVS